MKYEPSKQHEKSRVVTRTQKTLLPLVAVGGSLAGLPASALELGDLTIQSRLGQPLRASIAYVLAPNEQLTDSCVTLGARASASGLPGIGRTTISVGGGTILLTGRTPMREPMVAANVVVDCAHTPNLSREYMLFIDPSSTSFNEAAVAESTSVAPAAPVPQSAPVRRTAAVPTRSAAAAGAVKREPIGTSTRYRVQPGDSLSQIAERIENRSTGLWSAVNAIFEANPDAFFDNDANKLKAGSWLTIPSLDGSEPILAAASPKVSASAESALQESVTQIAGGAETAPAETSVAIPEEIHESIAEATTDLSPGDVVLESDYPFVDGFEATNDDIVIPDTEIAGPTTTSASPNVPTAVVNTSTPASTTSWLMWLAGGGIAIIIGLLLFGRLLRSRADEAIEEHPMRRATDEGTATAETIPPLSCELGDDSPTEENLTLDADLIVGTGLDTNTQMDVAQDFGFAAPTEVDIELPFEPESSIEVTETNILPPNQGGEETILETEILPGDEDYDLSVILDATKMPQPEDVTLQDLQAVQVPPEEDSSDSDSYTINKELNLNILEQDYQDELTATQALNAEIARAAAEIIGNQNAAKAEEVDDTGDWMTIRETAAMEPLATVTDLDATAHMPLDSEAIGDLDDTGINENVTVDMTADDFTVEMREADNDDDTTEIELDGGKVDTKAV
ncbi:MAG: LysM peptidoglycan-binding domain-containing protein [Gammaproteobacteria bacterium]|nr:LysM peptidoglycan-binding domain-containing protein [Gammaproteobacteria bacterium]